MPMLDHHAGPEHNETYSAKNGIGYGMFGGFIAIVASTGIILWIPLVQGLPTGAYVHALGTTIVGARNELVVTGLAGFGIFLVQGILVGTIFGIVTSRIAPFHPSNKKRGIAFGLATGIVAFAVLFLPITLAIYQQLASISTRYPPADVLIMGQQSGGSIRWAPSSYFPHFSATFGLGILAFLVYGIVLSGIVSMAYSVYHFDLRRITKGDQLQEKQDKEQKNGNRK
jgi:hypothetical protein